MRSDPQPEADAPDRFQVVPVRRGPELGAQVAHVGLQGALRAVRGVRGDALQQDGLGQDLAGVLHQQLPSLS